MLMQNPLEDGDSSLDITLLRSKLEAAKRERDAAQAKQDERDARRDHSNDFFFPRTSSPLFAPPSIHSRPASATRAYSGSSVGTLGTFASALNGESTEELQQHQQQQQQPPRQQTPQTYQQQQQQPYRPVLQLTTTNLCASPHSSTTSSPAISNLHNPRRANTAPNPHDSATSFPSPPRRSQPTHPSPLPRTNTLQTKIIPIKSGKDVVYEVVGLGTKLPSSPAIRATSAVGTRFPTSPSCPTLLQRAKTLEHDLDSIDLTRWTVEDKNPASPPPVPASWGGSRTPRSATRAREGWKSARSKSRAKQDAENARAVADGAAAAPPVPAAPPVALAAKQSKGWRGRKSRRDDKNNSIESWSAEVLDVPGRGGDESPAAEVVMKGKDEAQVRPKRSALMSMFKRS